ncbi:MAG: penicillin-binding protein activator [Rhodospirillaceae bacterium]|nr:penicillin-binding protein activator [Rhodospirillaceae bacterium]
MLLASMVLTLTACDKGHAPVFVGSQSAPMKTETQTPPSQYPLQQAALPPQDTLHATQPISREARVGVLLPLSGDAAAAGQALRNAALLAQFEVANPNLILQFYDTHGTPEGAHDAALQAKDQGAELFIGPLFSQSVIAVTSVAQSAGIPVLSFSSDSMAISNNVFVTGFLIQPQVERVVAFAAEQGLRRFAILAPSTPYGQAAVDAAQGAVDRVGGVMVRRAFFDPAKANFSPVIKDLTVYTRRKAALVAEKAKLAHATDPASIEALKRLEKQDTLGDVDFDALLLPMAGTSLRQVVSLLKFYDVDPKQVKFLGPLLWQDEALSSEPALVGAWFPAASRVGYEHFVARHTEIYGHPPTQIGSLAYDMVALAAALSRQSATPWRYLTANGGFIGVNGAFRLNPDGRVERMLAIDEVTRSGNRVVSPAPTRFAQDN